MPIRHRIEQLIGRGAGTEARPEPGETLAAAIEANDCAQGAQECSRKQPRLEAETDDQESAGGGLRG